MKINEVEACVGITKKNIRFYEAEGLLTPPRNSQNGYRIYGEQEVETLKRIKLLRKLGFPIEEIRKMQSGTLTVSDGMNRHRVILEREDKNIQQSINLCQKLAESSIKLEDLNASAILDEISNLESCGTTFHNDYKKDRKINMLASVTISSVSILVIIAFNWWSIWQMYISEDFPFLAIIIIMAISVCIILAILFVLFIRLKEITRGEIEQAKRY